MLSEGRVGIIFNVCQHPPPSPKRCHPGLNQFSVISFFAVHSGRHRQRSVSAAREEGDASNSQVVDILEKYGICSETDVSELEQHDFSELESRG